MRVKVLSSHGPPGSTVIGPFLFNFVMESDRVAVMLLCKELTVDNKPYMIDTTRFNATLEEVVLWVS